jgi:hypothetical protein
VRPTTVQDLPDAALRVSSKTPIVNVSRLLRVGVLLLCLAIVAAFAEPPTRKRALSGRPLLPRVEFLQVLFAPQRALLTNYYWLETIQSIGAALTEQEYRDVYDYATLVTDLDPLLYYAYTFAGLTISFNRGRETWVNTEESTAILEKGLKVFSRDAPLKLYLAYNLAYFSHDYRRAGLLLQDVAATPGAPSYVGPLATRLLAQSGDFDAGLALAQVLEQSAPDAETRAVFAKRVKQIQLERELQTVDKAITAYRARVGHLPVTVPELLVSGDLTRPPVDPMGGNVIIGPDGRAHSDVEQDRLELNLDLRSMGTP